MIDVNAHMQEDQYKDSVTWKMTREGLEVEGRVERTRGKPGTVRKIWRQNRSNIIAAAMKYGVPVELIIATIATESGGNPSALRKEPGYKSDSETPHRISPGIMQTLISTAAGALGRKVTRVELFDPRVSIMAGTAYISQQKRKTGLTPPKVAAAYNAGSVYHQKSPGNRWKMRQYPIGTGHHVDRFVQWFNDCFAMFALDGGENPDISFYSAFNGVKPKDKKAVEKKLEKDSRIVKGAKTTTFWTKVQGWLGGIFGAGAVSGTVIDRVTTTTDTTKGLFQNLGIDSELVLSLALIAVVGISIYIYIQQRKVINARVEDDISGKTDPTEY